MNSKSHFKIENTSKYDIYSALKPLHFICNILGLFPWTVTSTKQRKLKLNKILIYYSIFLTFLMISHVIQLQYSQKIVVKKINDIIGLFLLSCVTTNTICMRLFGVYHAKNIAKALNIISNIDIKFEEKRIKLDYFQTKLFIFSVVFLKISLILAIIMYETMQ